MSKRNNASKRSDEFMRLLEKHGRRLSIYVFSLVRNWSEAEDILQETRARLWEQYEEYNPEYDFGTWACTIARYMVLSLRKRASRDRLYFREEIERAIEMEISGTPQEEVDRRLELLAKCVQALDEKSRNLLKRCYVDGIKIKDIALESNRSPNATYLILSRIRRELHTCVENKLQLDQRD